MESMRLDNVDNDNDDDDNEVNDNDDIDDDDDDNTMNAHKILQYIEVCEWELKFLITKFV